MNRNKPTWEPKPEEYGQTLAEQNPWHLSGEVPETWAPEVERPIAKFLWRRLEINEPRRFQLVLGPRRVGKSTSLYQSVRRLMESRVSKTRIWWLRLDHPLLMQLDLGTLLRVIVSQSGATEKNPAFVFLDELTYARDWDLWLKTFFDERWPVSLAGSSSSTAAIRKRKLESGVGRWEEQYLAPYLFAEYLDLIKQAIEVPVCDRTAMTIEACIDAKLDISKLEEHRRRFLLTGGFPELLIANRGQTLSEGDALLQSQRTLRSDAVERAVYKDIPQAFGVENPMMLERLLYTLAGQFTGILSPTTICQTLDGLSQPTFDRYVSYLERSFLVFTLANYSGNEASKQRRGRKLYFVDGAVRNASLQRGLAPLNDAPELGLLMENLAAGHLHALSQQSQIRVYYWRDGENEVDLIYDHPEHPLAFEIGSSPNHHRDGLRALIERFPRFKGGCYAVSPNCQAVKASTAHEGIGSIPLDLMLLAISRQAERELEERIGHPSTTEQVEETLFDRDPKT